MYVKLLEIENYKSFLKTQKIPLEPGFNLFVGANNSGKTSALEVLDLKTRIDVPHRSVANLPAYGDLPSPTSRLKITIETDLSEYRGIFKNSLFIPVPLVFENLDNYHGRNLGERFYTALLDYPAISITYEITDGIQWASYGTSYGCSGGVKIDNSLPIRAVNIKFNSPDGTIQESDISNFSGLGHYISNARDFYQSRIYRFSAQRLPADKSPTVGDPILQPDAGNLPYCINHLHSNDAEGHRILCDLVHRIFPSVKWIQAPPIPGNQTFQLQCLPEFPEARRNDLAVPMGRMGSGIGNVIAILYVVLTARFPQVIAIDEPNSFLHPKALRELLGILAREGKQHQYILTAHSPDVLTAVRPATITMFELNDTFTVTKQVSGKDLPLLRTELAELGIRMTDLHAVAIAGEPVGEIPVELIHTVGGHDLEFFRGANYGLEVGPGHVEIKALIPGLGQAHPLVDVVALALVLLPFPIHPALNGQVVEAMHLRAPGQGGDKALVQFLDGPFLGRGALAVIQPAPVVDVIDVGLDGAEPSVVELVVPLEAHLLHGHPRPPHWRSPDAGSGCPGACRR